MSKHLLLRTGLIFLVFVISMACTRKIESVAAPMTSLADVQPSTLTVPQDSKLHVFSETVYVCKSSGAKKYHLKKSCHGIKRCKHEIEETTRKAAEGKGLGLCGYED